MKIRSLRLRLLSGAALWIAVALLITGAVIGYLFVSSVERTVRTELSASLSRLVALIDPLPEQGPSLAQPPSDARYDIPMSGVYWQIEDVSHRKTLRSRSLWDFVIDTGPAPTTGGEQFVMTSGPGGQSLSALTMLTRFSTDAGERVFRVTVAQDRAILNESIERFGKDLAMALAVLGVALVVAAFAQVWLGLRPLGKLRGDIEAIRHGAGDKVEERYPSEVLPLVGEVNALLASQQRSVDFARARASDLAHGLKTPLAVLSSVADTLRGNGDEANAAIVDELTGEMAQRIDYQLRLSRLRHRTRMHVLSASLNDVVARAASVLRRTREGERLEWRVDIEDGLELDIDGNDLIELVGVLLENAAKWASAVVQVAARRNGPVAELRISEDGPGLDPADLARLGIRGHRLDESAPGSGLGLGIAREIVALNNGSIDFAGASSGGLLVTVTLPLSGGAGMR